MTELKKIEGTAEAWETGLLGEDENHARVSTTAGSVVDDALGLGTVSVRVEKELTDMLQTIADIHGIGFETLVRDQLHRFAVAETKQLVIEHAPTLKQKEKEKPDDDCGGFDVQIRA